MGAAGGAESIAVGALLEACLCFISAWILMISFKVGSSLFALEKRDFFISFDL